ncbi:hypothetical protein CDIK_0048 [Cucumispora dikerogammari]|nr:hypothetical protein CDIK_0048 [Cucumispora dikerogammari]
MGRDRCSKLSNAQKETIWGWVNNNSLLTLKELKPIALEKLEIICSLPTINRALRELHFRAKTCILYQQPEILQPSLKKDMNMFYNIERLKGKSILKTLCLLMKSTLK